MHSLMLYGTLLASEAKNQEGTLYQDSCSVVPSLFNSALVALMFSLLDILLMLFAFYGLRKCSQGLHPQGYAALAISFLAHLVAAFATLPNRMYNGCFIALPSLLAVLVVTAILFSSKYAPHFLPQDQRRRPNLAPRSNSIN